MKQADVLVCVVLTDSKTNAVGEILENTVAGVKDTVKSANSLILEAVENTIEAGKDSIERVHELHEKLLDPYKKVMSMFKIDKMEDFTENVLDKVLEKFVDKFHCKFGIMKRSLSCQSTMCFNASTLLPVLNRGLPYVTRDGFESLSSVLLYYVSNMKLYCHTNIEIDHLEDIQKHQLDVIHAFSGGASGFLRLEKVQEALEELEDTYDDYNDKREDRKLSLNDLLETDDILKGLSHKHDDHHDDDGHDHRRKRGTNDHPHDVIEKASDVLEKRKGDHEHDIDFKGHDDDDHDDKKDDHDDDESHDDDDHDDDDDVIKKKAII
ncbi:hypothetical protein DPMN_193976 [Dreissena polymorpha]|uniref:Uncharacterized protein n=1 Tax=Dreissena polymorpha TaxID=45954 RepID=A0A9D4BEC6_DREPO|nr:hypothetical protein DPMN_193976 [Dreissena polymorpha]